LRPTNASIPSDLESPFQQESAISETKGQEKQFQTNDGNIAIISNNTLSAGPWINFTATERLTKKLADSSQK